MCLIVALSLRLIVRRATVIATGQARTPGVVRPRRTGRSTVLLVSYMPLAPRRAIALCTAAQHLNTHTSFTRHRISPLRAPLLHETRARPSELRCFHWTPESIAQNGSHGHGRRALLIVGTYSAKPGLRRRQGKRTVRLPINQYRNVRRGHLPQQAVAGKRRRGREPDVPLQVGDT